MSDIIKLTITQALKALKNREFSCVELTKAHIVEMGKHKELNAYITETTDTALEKV